MLPPPVEPSLLSAGADGEEAGILDADQRAVISLPPDASGVVVGAPGSGKSHTVIARVQALAAAGVPLDDVLVLTPTRQAATALRDRLAVAVGAATAGPLARSVAALAFQVVRAAVVHTGGEPPQLLTGPDEDRIVQDLLAGDADDDAPGTSRWPQWLPADVRGTKGFRTEVRAFLAEATALGLDPDALARRAARQDVEVWSSLASFAREYHDVRGQLRGAHRDAAGLVREAVALLRALPAGAPQLGTIAHLRCVLVDDAQELTLGGVELLEALRDRGVAVMAWGDPDVSSGAFRGATADNFARLARAVPIHVLGGAHRGTASQRALLAQVTSRIGAGGVVTHRRPPADAEPDGSVVAYALRSSAEEYDTVARLLRERHLHDGLPWSACAVIAHDARQVAALEAELAARDVPTGATGPTQALAAVRAVRDLLRVVDLAGRDDWGGDEAADVLLGSGFDPIELRRLRGALRQQAVSAAEADPEGGPVPAARELLGTALRHPLEFTALDTREGRRAARVAETIALVRAQLERGDTAHELLWTVWERSGREKAWAAVARGHGPLAAQAARDLDAVVALFQSAKRHGEREDGTAPIAFLRGLLDADVAEDRLSAPVPIAAVQVMTPAGALGTEFDTVVIAGVQDGVWPNLRARGSLLETWRLAEPEGVAPAAVDRRRGVLHDELRLFARAVSRARARLIVTAVDDDDAGPSALFDLLPPSLPAPEAAAHPLTLRGLVAHHRRTLTSAPGPHPGGGGQGGDARADAAAQLALLAAAGVPGADPAEWYGVAGPSSTAPLRDLAREDVRVSPSRLHALEECQLDWVVSDLGGAESTATAGLGTILHAAMENAVDADEERLWRSVEARWGELEFDAPWIEHGERVRARDLVARLAAYLRDSERAGVEVVSAEPHFEVRLPLDSAPAPREGEEPHGILLSGYIDRVERHADGRVVVVDLKTGRSEKTSAAAIAVHPQLAAYQLAYEAGGLAEGTPGGAMLLVLKNAGDKPYLTAAQAPFDDDTRAAFLRRLGDAAHVMRGERFLAPYEAHCRDDHTYGVCRIHTVGAVSSA